MLSAKVDKQLLLNIKTILPALLLSPEGSQDANACLFLNEDDNTEYICHPNHEIQLLKSVNLFILSLIYSPT